MTTVTVEGCDEQKQYKYFEALYIGEFAKYVVDTEMSISVRQMALTCQNQFRHVWDYWKDRGTLGAQCSDFTCNFALAFAHNVSKVGLRPIGEPA
jgi:hypothetical protein